MFFRWLEITKWRGDVVVFLGGQEHNTTYLLMRSTIRKSLSEWSWVCLISRHVFQWIIDRGQTVVLSVASSKMKQCWIIYPWRSHRGCNEFAIKETTPAIRWWRLVSTMRRLQCLCNWAESVSFQSCCNWLLRVLKFFMELASVACNFEAKSRSANLSFLEIGDVERQISI